MNYFEYNGVKSSDMGLRIKSKNVYSSPKFDSQLKFQFKEITEMKTTYLIKSIQSDGSTALVETSAEHWHEITENNKLLPKDERRYFITDIISESGNLDCMIIEVAYEEYLRWMVERSQTMRNNSLKKQYAHLSLDAEIADDAVDPVCFEEDVMSQVFLMQLQKVLEVWNPWAVDFLDCYLKGKKTSSTAFVANKYNVSQRMARNYKKQFEDFVKKYVSDFRF